MRIVRVHQRVVPNVSSPRLRPAALTGTRYHLIRAHHDSAATLAAVAAGSGIGLLVLATRLFAA